MVGNKATPTAKMQARLLVWSEASAQSVAPLHANYGCPFTDSLVSSRYIALDVFYVLGLPLGQRGGRLMLETEHLKNE